MSLSFQNISNNNRQANGSTFAKQMQKSSKSLGRIIDQDDSGTRGSAACWANHSARVAEQDVSNKALNNTVQQNSEQNVSEIVIIPYQDLIDNGRVADFVSPSGDEVPASAPSKTPPSVLELKDEVYSDEQLNPAKKGSFLHGLASWVGSSLSGLAKGINGLIHRLINLFAPVDNSYDAYKDYR